MANLLDTIRSNTTQATQPAGVTDETQKISTLLRARSGKAIGGGDVGQSNLQETSAVDQTNQVLQQQVAPQAAIQQAGLEAQSAQQAQTAGIQKAEISQARQHSKLQDKIRTEQLLAAFERDQGQLDLEKNRAQVNQFAQNLRLQNDRYISDLKREGDRARLLEGNRFSVEYTRQAFDNNDELLGKQFKNDSIANATDRDWNKQLAQMDIDGAWSMFRAEQKANQQRSTFQGIGQITQAGVGAYGQYQQGAPAREAAEKQALQNQTAQVQGQYEQQRATSMGSSRMGERPR